MPCSTYQGVGALGTQCRNSVPIYTRGGTGLKKVVRQIGTHRKLHIIIDCDYNVGAPKVCMHSLLHDINSDIACFMFIFLSW